MYNAHFFLDPNTRISDSQADFWRVYSCGEEEESSQLIFLEMTLTNVSAFSLCHYLQATNAWSCMVLRICSLQILMKAKTFIKVISRNVSWLDSSSSLQLYINNCHYVDHYIAINYTATLAHKKIMYLEQLEFHNH